MKQILKYGLGCLLVTAFPAIFIACSEDKDFAELPSATYPASIEMILPADVQPLLYKDEQGATTLPLVKGEQVALEVTIAPDDVTFKDVKWTSSNEDVATVDVDGNLTAVSGDGIGYSVIQVAPDAYYSGSNIAATMKVVVVNSLVKAETLTLTSPADAVYAGETLQLSVAIAPEDATYKTVKWSSSNEKAATVDANGLVTGLVNDEVHAKAIITATSLDGGNVVASKEITVNQIVQPQEVTLDQSYSVDKGYVFAIGEKKTVLNYTTVPADCPKSLIQWTSSGVVTFNREGVFGDVTITATCPETGKNDAVTLHLEEGLIRELFHDENNYGWYNSEQSGNGTSTSHVWHDGYLTITTYAQNATKQRGDFKCWDTPVWLHAGKYPIFAIRMDDVKDLYDGVTVRNITFDAVGTCAGADYKGGLDGNNNKWLHDYKCSDGSHVFIYDLSQQKWATGGILPTGEVAKFTSMQFKYADIATLTEQVTYNVYWVQTFKNLDDLKKYITSEGLSYETIK